MSHFCLWPGCKTKVGNDQWGCNPHWRALPNDLRAWIGRAYRVGSITDTHPTDAWLEAHRAALQWIERTTEETKP